MRKQSDILKSAWLKFMQASEDANRLRFELIKCEELEIKTHRDFKIIFEDSLRQLDRANL